MAMTSDLVSSTIVARAREPEGLRKMMIVSAVAHSVAIVAIVLGPWLFGTQRRDEAIMEVSFNAPGALGPDSGGMTAESRKAVQKAAPKPELPKPEPVRPPAAQTPAMVEPISKPAPPKPTQRQPSQATKSATPTTGETVRSGQ